MKLFLVYVAGFFTPFLLLLLLAAFGDSMLHWLEDRKWLGQKSRHGWLQAWLNRRKP